MGLGSRSGVGRVVSSVECGASLVITDEVFESTLDGVLVGSVVWDVEPMVGCAA